ncbi:MAG: ABC transporter ATP-binding protein [Actinobacteria bacterium]|nr:ABC transporter ATP-binding protein [Actinomycetota bacterium]
MNESKLAKAADTGLRLQGISHSFSDGRGRATDVLAGVSFEVGAREFVSLMGPSGCGKSTVLGMVAGFLSPEQGDVRWHGERVTAPDAARGVVFQKPHLYPWCEVYDNVMFGPRALGRERESRDLARDLIAEVGLEGFERHRPYELSGGMQHRVALARTLVNRPELLLMDEPFAALDAQTREEMQALLLEVWQRHRCTVLFVTHDIEEGLLLSDRILVMGHRPGSIRADISVDFERPRDETLVFDQRFVDLRSSVRTLFRKDSS